MSWLVIATILLAVSAQSPVPVDNVDLNKVLGPFYIVWAFGGDLNNQTPLDITCFTSDIWIEGNNANITYTSTISGNTGSTLEQYTIQADSGNAVWLNSEDALTFEWLWVSEPSYAYALLGSKDVQSAVLLFRNPITENGVVDTIIQKLQDQGYNVDTYNWQVINNNCTAGH